jgi:hypothetical protein
MSTHPKMSQLTMFASQPLVEKSPGASQMRSALIYPTLLTHGDLFAEGKDKGPLQPVPSPADKTKACFKLTMRGASSVAFVGFLVHMMIQSPKTAKIGPLIQQSNFYLPLWYIIIYCGGILPTIMINALTGKWTAPPFIYPPKGAATICIHVIPAVLWLVGSIVQVYLTTVGDFVYHRVNGNPFMAIIFVTFELSALYSLVKDLSPLGRHVKFMEWALAIGTFIYFVMGMVFISSGIPEYHTGHKICMNVCMITASGPGLFRVLRHLRELVSGRLFQVSRFTNYADIPGSPYLRNFRDVESTYFCLAFLITDAYAGLVFYREGILFDSPWSTLGWSFLILPVFAVVLSILLRFVPGIDEDFKWTPALNYNWPVLKPVLKEVPDLVNASEAEALIQEKA